MDGSVLSFYSALWRGGWYSSQCKCGAGDGTVHGASVQGGGMAQFMVQVCRSEVYSVGAGGGPFSGFAGLLTGKAFGYSAA